MYVKSNAKVNTQAGFSLIELMVVVAIIGLLAAIAVPQFSKFQNRAKQSEAQTHMSGIYTGEQAFQAQWGSFYDGLDSIGYAVAAAQTRYNCGFTALGAAVVGVPAGTHFTLAGGACTNGTVNCTPTSDAGAYPALPGGTTGATSATVFTAGCSAKFQSSAAAADSWTINQAQLVSNTAVGI